MHEPPEQHVGIIGLGYVGLPLAAAFHDAGCRVLGFDTDPAKIDKLASGTDYIRHADPELVPGLCRSDRFEPTGDPARLAEPDALLICVPTPLAPGDAPDLSAVESTARTIAGVLRPGQLVVLESTTYPGTTRDVVGPLLAQSGLNAGSYHLAYSPEREDPGRRGTPTRSIPKVVGGIDEASTDAAARLYGCAFDTVVRVDSAETAEASKLVENLFRSVNIALVNELKVVFDAMGLDVRSVLDAAETKPFGFMRFEPGPGLGGHCIPIDPYYLAHRAKQAGVDAKFVELAGSVNRAMPPYAIAKLEAALQATGGELDGSKILVLGLAYKPNVADPRESPSFVLIESLEAKGSRVSYHDPHIPAAPAMRNHSLEHLRSIELTPENLAGFDAVLIATDHDAIDWSLVAQHARLIVDTRGRMRGLDAKGRVIDA